MTLISEFKAFAVLCGLIAHKTIDISRGRHLLLCDNLAAMSALVRCKSVNKFGSHHAKHSRCDRPSRKRLQRG